MRAGERRSLSQEMPAATAATRVSRASFVLGGLGLASAIFVVVRLFETWRVGARATGHQVSIVGLTLSYPAANVEAIVVLFLAAVGLATIALAIEGAVREVGACRRFQRSLAAQDYQHLHGAFLITDRQPRAFCVGLLRPRVYFSTGAIAVLDDGALRAVLAHELHHAHRHDPLRLAVGRVLARALFFLPGLGDLVRRQQGLAELSADESAVSAAPANRSALARAMLSFSDAAPADTSTGFDPTRVDYLLGDAPSWQFPVLLCLGVAAVIAVLAAVTLLAGRLASGSATLALPFLSGQPCVIVLAAIPAGGAIFAFARRRTRAQPAR